MKIIGFGFNYANEPVEWNENWISLFMLFISDTDHFTFGYFNLPMSSVTDKYTKQE